VTELLRRLNRGVYRLERSFVVVALLAMAVVVFLDVVHRAFASEDNKVTLAVVKVSGWFGAAWEPGTAMFDKLNVVVPWIAAATFVLLTQFAIRTATRARPVSQGLAWFYAVAGVIAVYGLTKLFVLAMPNGLIWSQNFALVLTLWVGFFGASMATYEHKHLAVEAVQRHIPPALRKWVAFVSALLTAVFCAALFWLTLRFVIVNYSDYVSTGKQGGLISGLEMPRYLAFMTLPISFTVMVLRFLGIAVAALQGRIAEVDPLAGLVDEATKAAIDANLRPESEIPTEAIRPADHEGPLSSSRMRPVSSDSGKRRRPSDVITDRHDAAAPEGETKEPAKKEPAVDEEKS
jgi:TRAP-type C4-dicarboxylate transport system permease small subunit